MAETKRSAAQAEQRRKIGERIGDGFVAAHDQAWDAIEDMKDLGRVGKLAAKGAGSAGLVKDAIELATAKNKGATAAEVVGSNMGSALGGFAGSAMGPVGAFVGAQAGGYLGEKGGEWLYDHRDEIRQSLVNAALRGWGPGDTDGRVRNMLLNHRP